MVTRADEQRALATEGVGQPASQQCTDGGTREKQRAHDSGFADGAEVQLVLHVEQRTGDHTGVVAEQQTPERGYDGELGQEAFVTALVTRSAAASAGAGSRVGCRHQVYGLSGECSRIATRKIGSRVSISPECARLDAAEGRSLLD